MHNLARLDLRLRQVSGSPQEQPFVPRSAQATQVLRCQRTYDDKCPQMFNDNAKLWEWVRVCESIIILNCNFTVPENAHSILAHVDLAPACLNVRHLIQNDLQVRTKYKLSMSDV